MKYRILFIIILIFTLQGFSEENLFFRAMQNEIERAIEGLRLEGLQKPCFISSDILKGDFLVIRSVLGSTISLQEQPARNLSSRVMAGSYERNNENFFSFRGARLGGRQSLPIEDCYFGTRRALWLDLDRAYKHAAETYEQKISAMRQQNVPEEIRDLSDFSKSEKTVMMLPSINFRYDRDKWEAIANEISALFVAFPDIQSSGVSIYFYRSNIYHYNSEGTKIRKPFNLAAVYVDAATQADDGEPVFDYLAYFGITPDDLPDKGTIINDTRLMAKNITILREASVFDEAYLGPVLFEGCSVGEIISQSLFPQNGGLNAVRKPIFSDSRVAAAYSMMVSSSFEDLIGRRAISRDFNLKASPKLRQYNGINLIGSYQVDAEGVVPSDELIIIEEGMLKTMLSGRTPTPRIQQSNGHNRTAMSGGRITSQVGPGVIRFEPVSDGKDREDLRSLLIKTAQEEGLEYGIIIRKVLSPSPAINMPLDPMELIGRLTQSSAASRQRPEPVYVYRVYVEDGREELVRSAELQNISLRAFRDIIGWSDNMLVHNTISVEQGAGSAYINILRGGGGGWPLSGILSSFIVPDALLFESLELKRERRAVTANLPVNRNPLLK